jgi:hypothetical protein
MPFARWFQSTNSLVGLGEDLGSELGETLPDGSTVVFIVAMPPFRGPYSYDSVNEVAIAYIAPLALAQLQQTAYPSGTLWQAEITDVQAVFDQQTQIGFGIIFTSVALARASGGGTTAFTNRMAYVQQLFNWTGAIQNAYTAAVAAVNAALTSAAATAVQLGQTQAQAGLLAANGTLSGLTSTLQISVGMTVTGTGITPFSTTVTGTPTTGSTTITGVSSIVGLAAGQAITGTGIPAGAFITSASGTSIGISAPATSSPGPVQLAIQTPAVLVATVPSGTSVTLSGGTYTVQSGQTYTFAMPVAPSVTIPGALAIPN